MPNVFSLREIKSHNKINDCWLIANNKVYNSTLFIKNHPAHAKRILKDVYKKYKKYSVAAKKQGHYIRTNFSREKMGELVGNILEANIPKFAQQVDLKLPEINANVELPKLS